MVNDVSLVLEDNLFEYEIEANDIMKSPDDSILGKKSSNKCVEECLYSAQTMGLVPTT